MNPDKATIFEAFKQRYTRKETAQELDETYEQKEAYLESLLEENADLLYGLFWDEYNRYLSTPESQRRSTISFCMPLFDRIMQKPTHRALCFAGGLLLDPHYPVRDFVAEALGKMGSMDAYNYLMAVALDDDPQIASRAVYALGQIGATQAEPLLIDIVNGNIQAKILDDLVQAYALDALYLLGTPTAWNAIALLAAGRRFDVYTRRDAIRVLALTKDKAFIPLLRQLTDDENQMVREYAADYLIDLEKSS